MIGAGGKKNRGRMAGVIFTLSISTLVASSGLAAAGGGGSGAEDAGALLYKRPLPESDGWHEAGLRGVRGLTIGPIENGYHANVGYGSAPFVRTLEESRNLGAGWVALTPFGRVHDLDGMGVDPTFEAPAADTRAAIRQAIREAHAHGLHVMLVPHLWVESGGWRALIDPKTDEGWKRWTASYRSFVLSWAKVAADEHVEMLSLGVELRSWVTTSRAPSFVALTRDVRKIYPGLLTYSANWDDVDETVILGELDVIGINAFYPLADHDGASLDDLRKGGQAIRTKVHDLAERWQRPVLFTEMGYTTRTDPAIKPWEWPDRMKDVKVDEAAQAIAYHALLAPLLDEPDFAGFFVWRVYSDPDDVSQESEWGFSPRGKLAEHVLRDAFAASWAADADRDGLTY
jgi:hypothetical protein